MSGVSVQKVSAAMRKAGLPAAQWLASGRIRGWGDWSSGVRVRREPDGTVVAYYTHGRWHKGTDEGAARERQKIADALDASGVPYTEQNGYFRCGSQP